MTGQVLPFPTTGQFGGTPCPSWCASASTGHAYRFGLDDSDPPTFHRLHSLRLGDLADGQARLDLHQLETTVDPNRPGDLAPAEVVLSMTASIDGAVCLPSADALAGFIDSLHIAADRLENDGAWDL